MTLVNPISPDIQSVRFVALPYQLSKGIQIGARSRTKQLGHFVEVKYIFDSPDEVTDGVQKANSTL